MDYLTKLYKHRAEQLQEQISVLESKLKDLMEAPQISDAAADFNQQAMETGKRYVVDKSGFVQSYNPQSANAPSVPSPRDFNRASMEPGKVYTVSRGGYAQSDVNAPENRPAPEQAPAPSRNAGVSPTGRGTTPNAAAQMAGGVTKALDDVRRGMPSLASDNRTLSYLPPMVKGQQPNAPAPGNQGSNFSGADIAAGNKFFDDFEARFGGPKGQPAAPAKPSYDFGKSSADLVSMSKGLLDKFGPARGGEQSSTTTSNDQSTRRVMATDDPNVSTFDPGSLTAPSAPAPGKIQLTKDSPYGRRELEKELGFDFSKSRGIGSTPPAPVAPTGSRTPQARLGPNDTVSTSTRGMGGLGPEDTVSTSTRGMGGEDITVDPARAAAYRKEQAMQRVRETEAERPDMMPASINPDGPGDRRYDSIEDMRARRTVGGPRLGVMQANSPRERREIEARAYGYTVPGDEQQVASPAPQAQNQNPPMTSGRKPIYPGSMIDIIKQMGMNR